MRAYVYAGMGACYAAGATREEWAKGLAAFDKLLALDPQDKSGHKTLALENIATLVVWPEDTIDEADFIAELLDRTGATLLLDIENVYANALQANLLIRQI